MSKMKSAFKTRNIGVLIFSLILVQTLVRQLHFDYREEFIVTRAVKKDPVSVDVFGTGRSIRTFYNMTLEPPGVLVLLKGGIGNQLFQYACSYALAKRRGWPLYVEYKSALLNGSNRKFLASQREFALDKFHIPLENFIEWSFTKFPATQPLLWVSDAGLMRNTFNQTHQFVALDGASYCQSELYWKDFESEVRQMFEPRLETESLRKLKPLVDDMRNSDSVALHIRRGDFVRAEGFYVPISYQRRAIRVMVDELNKTRGVERPSFFVFSDDINHTKAKLKDFEESYRFVYVSGNHTSIEDFFLMMQCKHIILPNSTFSWWAAYLNKNKEKIVIVSAFNPTYWRLFTASEETLRYTTGQFGSMYHRREWIVINPFTGGLRSPD